MRRRASVANRTAVVLLLVAAAVLIWAARPPAGPRVTLLEPPGVSGYARILGDTAILPNGRRVTPAGRVLRTQSYAWGLAISPDESTAALVNADAIEIVPLSGGRPVTRIPPWGEEPDDTIGAGTYMGVAFTPDGRGLYFGSADEGAIKLLRLDTGAIETVVSLDAGGYEDSFVGDFALSADGRTLYAVDQANFRLVTIDLARRAVVGVRARRPPPVRGVAFARRALRLGVERRDVRIPAPARRDARQPRDGGPGVPTLRRAVTRGGGGHRRRRPRGAGPRQPQPSGRDVGVQGGSGGGRRRAIA